MSDGASKTEQPTPKRLQEAEKKGQVPRSRLWTGAATMLGGLSGAMAVADRGSTQLRSWASQIWSLEPGDPVRALEQAAAGIATCTLPVCLGALVAGVVASVLSSGLRFQPALAVPQLDRIDPAAGLRKIFSFQQIPERLRDLVLVVLIAWVGKVLLSEALSQGLRELVRGDGGFSSVLLNLGGALKTVVLLLGAAGILDLVWARHRHRAELMMTREEVRQESKDTEGDPHFRAMRRSIQRALSQGGPARGIKSATVVVVNPTHVAVALRYDELECGAPYLVAKGLDDDALRLKAEARALGVPIIPNIPLARGLYLYEVGDAVPEELYRAAAAVLHAAMSDQAGSEER